MGPFRPKVHWSRTARGKKKNEHTINLCIGITDCLQIGYSMTRQSVIATSLVYNCIFLMCSVFFRLESGLSTMYIMSKTEWAYIYISHNSTPHFLWLDCGRTKCERASKVEPQPVRSFTFKMASTVVALAYFLRLMMHYWLKRRQAYRRSYRVHSILGADQYGECHHLLDVVLSDTENAYATWEWNQKLFISCCRHLPLQWSGKPIWGSPYCPKNVL